MVPYYKLRLLWLSYLVFSFCNLDFFSTCDVFSVIAFLICKGFLYVMLIYINLKQKCHWFVYFLKSGTNVMWLDRFSLIEANLSMWYVNVETTKCDKKVHLCIPSLSRCNLYLLLNTVPIRLDILCVLISFGDGLIL